MNGIFTALLTPFNDDYTINEASLKKLVEFNLEKGVNGFYVGGSTGEGMVMSPEERKEVFRIVKEAAGDRVPMIAHCGAISTDSAIDMAKTAEALGYTAVSAVAPFYYSFPYPAIRKYYDDIVSSVSIPMVVYNFPGGNGFTFTADYAAEMFEDERFIGIKHTSADLFVLQQFKQKIKRPVTVFNGFDEMCLGGLSMGADGAIGSTYNFMADRFLKIYDEFHNGNIEKAQKIQNGANEIIAEMIKYGVFQCEKAVLTHMGIDMGPCRRPFLPISKEGFEAMKKVADDCKAWKAE
ncbi:MAG: N-acetylneuraminate lyase [Oscillospiraceae bacterium]|nr:N-acetylneuraminate lyase [Oscillospiraceae bacterium]